MTLSTLLYLAGAVLEGWLAAMLLVASRELRGCGGVDRGRSRWPRWLAAGYALGALRSAVLATGNGLVDFAQPPGPLPSLLALGLLVSVTASLLDYTGVGEPAARRAKLAAAGLMGLVWIAGAAGAISRGAAVSASALVLCGWALLLVRAMRREPRTGHGLVVAAILFFPVTMALGRSSSWAATLMPMFEIVPLTALGTTVLTTGLIRAHRAAQREMALAAAALAARERAEAQLRIANESLEQRVAQRTAELRETIEGLESFNRSVSHDLRGPLGGIAGVARMARELVADGRADQADRMLAAISRQADTSMQLVATLLALARAGDAEPQRAAFEAGALVEEVVEAQSAAWPGVTIVVQPLPRVDADAALLRQVFVNLVANACKFAAGGVLPRVEIGHEQTPCGPTFYVRDNGVGFAPEDAGRLFRPFERLHGARFEGFGVGLSIVRRIVEHHGGRVWAEGSPGQGATFRFTLGGHGATAERPGAALQA
ncbi:MAG: sensor histidine kinase [Burkholderiaceae bacterium]